jgi:Ca2+-binding EF-hand superfamily protein
MGEWINYYNNISANIDNDQYFELMICNAWHITLVDEKTGEQVNTSNLRIMVTNSQGIESVVLLENDLGINSSNKDDIKLLYSRLKSQGVKDIYAINGKIIKVVTVNGVEIITSIGNTSTLKDDTNTSYNKNSSAPQVLKAPTLPRRPQSAAPTSTMNRPIAGVPELTVNSTRVNLSASNPPPVTVNKTAVGSSNLQINTKNLTSNILSSLNKRKEINSKIQEENIIGNTLLGVLKVQLLSKGLSGIIDLQRKFNEYDNNGNGSIDLEEFKSIIQLLQLTFDENQIENLFHFLDYDGSNEIDYLELLEGLRVRIFLMSCLFTFYLFFLVSFSLLFVVFIPFTVSFPFFRRSLGSYQS